MFLQQKAGFDYPVFLVVVHLSRLNSTLLIFDYRVLWTGGNKPKCKLGYGEMFIFFFNYFQDQILIINDQKNSLTRTSVQVEFLTYSLTILMTDCFCMSVLVYR